MEQQHPAVVHQETPNERHNAVALTVFAVIMLVLAAFGATSNVNGGVWVAMCAGVLGMSATFEGIQHGQWRCSAAIFAAGMTLIMVCAKLFSLDLSFIVYKIVAYILLLTGLAMMGIGLRGYSRDASAFMVTAVMALTGIITIAAALLSIGTRTISYEVAAAAAGICIVVFAAAVTVTALSVDQAAGANVVGPSGGWQPKQG
jgi:hypothetical protein